MAYADEHRKEKQRAASLRYYYQHRGVCRARRRAYYRLNGNKERAERRAYYHEHRAQERAYNSAYFRRLREDIVQHYGAMCACCGERQVKFLAIDHVHGGGNRHRRAFGGSYSFYLDIKKRGFPTDFQILCHNCNFGRQINGGICPHKEATQ